MAAAIGARIARDCLALRRYSISAGCRLALVCFSLTIPSMALAQTTSGDSAAGATLYNANCDGCHGATVGSIRPAIKNAASAGGLINKVMVASMGGYTVASFTSTQENMMAIDSSAGAAFRPIMLQMALQCWSFYE